MAINCSSLEEVRDNVDRIDRQMVALIADRAEFVKQAAQFKKTTDDVKAPSRVEQVISKAVSLSKELGGNPKVTEVVYRAMISAFIEEELDPGETEALKILNDRDDCFFCTCDKAAIKVISLLGKRDQGLSFEELLKSSGITKKLEKKHTEQYFRKYLDEGSILRIQRFGLKDK